ncbi:hypothetical protein ASF44_21395 [Pseudorhodoferax sp. Leaf274]|nr:hypothetical protein ASF44_21395 [Pseudorhodoferax sp. Leaf274]
MVAVESSSRLFALRLADGSARVFSQHSGLPVQVGELLVGYTDITGFRLFAYGGGFCRAYCEAGPLSHEVALGLLLSQLLQMPAGAPPSSEKESHVDRSLLP